MYPVNVQSFIPAVTHFKHTALVGLPGEHAQKSGSENLAAAPPQKAETSPWLIRSTSVFKSYL